MKTRLLTLSVSLALVALLAACGGGSGSGTVPNDAIAKVDSTSITKASFNSLMNVGLARYKAAHQPAPKPGTAPYAQLRDQAVSFLVQQEELQQEAQKLGVTVTQQDVDKQLATIRKTYYKGSQKKLMADLKKHYLTLDQLEQYSLRPNLLTTKLQAKVSSNVKVTTAAAQKYYDQNKASYTTTSPNRSVRHILVSSKSLAEKLETKLKHGASFAALAKKYSTDKGSGQVGGKLLAVKGKLVPPFQKVAFSLKTGKISAPVHSQYGWHIIQALGPVRSKYTQPFSELKSQIEANLAQQQKSVAWQNWLTKMPKDFKVSYQTGYAPAATTTATTTTAPTTTG